MLCFGVVLTRLFSRHDRFVVVLLYSVFFVFFSGSDDNPRQVEKTYELDLPNETRKHKEQLSCCLRLIILVLFLLFSSSFNILYYQKSGVFDFA